MDTKDFLLEDYKVKVQYFNDHLSRMWTRFNFLLTLNSALFAFSVQDDAASFTLLFIAAGILLSILWYIFGANDNYLVEVYRQEIQRSYDFLKNEIPDSRGAEHKEEMKKLSYAGCVRAPLPQDRLGLLQWRWDGSKYTSAPQYMAAIMPIAFTLLWITRSAALWGPGQF